MVVRSPHSLVHPLAQVREDLSACIKCAACMPVCPTYTEARRESMGPRGRLALAVGLLDGRLGPGDGAAGPISSCIDCRACVPACPRKIPLAHVFYAAKAELAAQGAGGALPRLLRWVSRRVVVKNRFSMVLPLLRAAVAFYRKVADDSILIRLLPFVSGGRKRLLPAVAARPMTDDYPEVAAVDNPKGRVAFFPGCVINFSDTAIGHATMNAMAKLEIEVVLPKEAPCCGIPLLSLGDTDGAKAVARDVIARYGTLEADYIVTACASCGTTLRDTYPELLAGDAAAADARALAGRVLDITEYVTRHTDYENMVQAVEGTVTYHDPCHLVRGMGVTEEPRRIVNRVAKEGLTEMDGADRCCGFGGLFSALHYDLSLQVGKNKAESVRQSGARVVATGCPGCRMHMSDTLSRNGVSARVVHTVELLDAALPANKNVSAGKTPTVLNELDTTPSKNQ